MPPGLPVRLEGSRETSSGEKDIAMLQSILLAAFAAFVPLVLIANVAVEAVPHVRGLGDDLRLPRAGRSWSFCPDGSTP